MCKRTKSTEFREAHLVAKKNIVRFLQVMSVAMLNTSALNFSTFHANCRTNYKHRVSQRRNTMNVQATD